MCGTAAALALLLKTTTTICVFLLVAGCISSTTSLNLEKLHPVHFSELVSESNESVNVRLVERESGGLIVLTDTHLAYYNQDFKFERTLKFKHRYYGFGLMQGPDGPWFAGYEWWSWMYGVLHNMNFDVHAMPVGDSEPKITWPCKNCSELSARRFAEPLHDYLYAASVRHDPPWVGFDVRSGERFGARTRDELMEVLVEEHRDEPQRSRATEAVEEVTPTRDAIGGVTRMRPAVRARGTCAACTAGALGTVFGIHNDPIQMPNFLYEWIEPINDSS